MALGLSLTLWGMVLTALLASCSPRPAQQTTLASSSSGGGAVESPEQGAPAEGRAAWPPPGELLVAQSLDGQMALRAWGPAGVADFAHVLAADVHESLYDEALELLWFSDRAARLWVIDLRGLASRQLTPTLIASRVSEHAKLAVQHAERYISGPGEVGEEAAVLVLHWEEAPWLGSGDGEGQRSELEGRAWLERELARPRRPVPEPATFHDGAAHVALPAGIGECFEPSLCGAAQPFGSRGWQLVLAKNDQTSGDLTHNGCLLYEPSTRAFSQPPPAPLRWAAVVGPELDTCGPYHFNAEGTAFAVSDKVCALGGECQPLGGYARGWLVPGVTVDSE